MGQKLEVRHVNDAVRPVEKEDLTRGRGARNSAVSLSTLRRWSDVDLASSWATAHTADQRIPRDASLHSPFCDSFEINWVGQIRHGLLGRVGET